MRSYIFYDHEIFLTPCGNLFKVLEYRDVVADFEDLPSKSFVQPDAAFIGHSLGELSALLDILLNSALVDVVFCCGLTMQCAVEGDEHSHSNYAMYAYSWTRRQDVRLRGPP